MSQRLTDFEIRWQQRMIADYQYLSKTVHPRINRMLRLLRPQTQIDPNDADREAAPWARRIVRNVGSLGFLQAIPKLDAEYFGREQDKLDYSNELEDLIELVADRTSILQTLKRAHVTNSWSPVSIAKIKQPIASPLSENTRSVITTQILDGTMEAGENLERLSPDQVKLLRLQSSKVAPISGGYSVEETEKAVKPKRSLDVPIVEWIDPRHVIMEPKLQDPDHSRYVAHIVPMPRKQFMASSKYNNKESVKAFYTGDPNNLISWFSTSISDSFSIPSTQELVVLVEVWIREDSDDPDIRNVYGVMELLSGKWVSGPVANPYTIWPWYFIVAADDYPSMWEGPSYIEQAWDDINDAAFLRKKMRKHMEQYASHKDFVPEGTQFSPEAMEKYADPEYNGLVEYSGNAPPQSPMRPQMPPALPEMMSFIEANFTKNTGITSTQQGDGQSNKVATAFRQEANYASERLGEIKFKVYDFYRKIMLGCLFLLEKFLMSEDSLTIYKKGMRYQFSRDIVTGIMDLKISTIDASTSDPFQARMLDLQSIKFILGEPTLAPQFNPRELAVKIARTHGWGSRVLNNSPNPGPSPESLAESAISGGKPGGIARPLGTRVDGAAPNGDTGTALSGVPNR